LHGDFFRYYGKFSVLWHLLAMIAFVGRKRVVTISWNFTDKQLPAQALKKSIGRINFIDISSI